MEVKFTIPGNPRGKQRPRLCKFNGKSYVYTPKETADYEKLVRSRYLQAYNLCFEKNVPLEVFILASFNIPKKINKSLKTLMLAGAIYPTKKPDCDNIIKIVLDGLNGVAYHDDSQICKIHFKKNYSEAPGVAVLIRNIGEIYEHNKNL